MNGGDRHDNRKKTYKTSNFWHKMKTNFFDAFIFKKKQK